MASQVLINWQRNPKGTMVSTLLSRKEEGGADFRLDENLDSKMEYSYETSNGNP